MLWIAIFTNDFFNSEFNFYFEYFLIILKREEHNYLNLQNYQSDTSCFLTLDNLLKYIK
jgi:hypothetical protein